MKEETLIPETKPDYFAIKRLSNSAMKYFKLSPMHYLHYISDSEKKVTTAMVFGSAFHCMILEAEKFDDCFAMLPQLDRRTNAGKDAARIFEQENIGKQIITADEHATLIEMQTKIFAHEPSMELLNQVKEAEKEVLWSDKITGIELKGKLDGLGNNFILDLKTCQSAQPNQFAVHAFDYDYHRQAALYVDGCAANSIPANNFYFIAIEKEPPYGISVNRASEAFVENGRKDYQQILENFRYWKELGEPNVGYEFNSPFNQFDIQLPAWVK